MHFPPAIKYHKNGTVYYFSLPFDRYTYCEPFLQILSLHLILAYHAGTTLKYEVRCFRTSVIGDNRFIVKHYYVRLNIKQ